MACPSCLAMPMVALKRVAFCLASAVWSMIPLGKKRPFPSPERRLKTVSLSLLMISLSSLASGLITHHPLFFSTV